MIEELFPIGIFLIYVIAKLIQGLDKDSDANKKKTPFPSQPQTTAPQQSENNSEADSMGAVKEKIKEKSNQMREEQEFVKQTEKAEIRDEKNLKNRQNNKISPIKRNSITRKDKSSIDLNFNNEQELLKGIIYKEVLDKPRAKKSYLPPYLQ